jgi:ribosomal 50S subunit-recycling heat shock protein
VSDSYNNTATASTDHAYSVDLKAPTIAIDATLAGDNVVNEAEQKQPLTISGTTSGVEDGQTVDVQFNGEHYTANVSNNHWTLDVPAAHLSNLADGQTYTITANVHDLAGNSAAPAKHDLGVHVTAPEAFITVDNVTADNILNINEFYGDVVTITGTVGGDAKLDDKVTLDIGGALYETKVIDINGQLGFSVDVGTGDLSGATKIHATVSVSDSYNNTATASTDHDYLVDLTSPKASITVDPVTADNVLNIQETNGSTVTVTGTVGGDVKVGDTVTLTVNGHDATGKVWIWVTASWVTASPSAAMT